MKQQPTLLGILGGIATITFLVALAAYIYIGFFARYLADDYCTAAVFTERGLIGAQKYWYTSWSGRYTFYFLVDLAELGGPKLAPVLPAVAVIIWLLALIWLLLQVGLLAQIPYTRFSAILMATLILFATLASTPDVIQSLYWRTGMLTYVAPLIFLTVYSGGVVYVQRHETKINGLWLVAAFMVTFIAGGFSETYAVFQAALLGCAALCSWFFGTTSIKRIALPMLVAGVGGAMLAILVVALAPGNQVRQAFFSQPGWLFILFLSIKNTLYYLYVNLSSPLMLVITLFFSMLLAVSHVAAGSTLSFISNSRHLLLGLLLWPVISGLVLIACFFPAVYGMSAYPPYRTLIIPQFFLIWLVVSWGYLAGLLVNRLSFVGKLQRSVGGVGLSYIIILPLLIVGPVHSTWQNIKLADMAQRYAQSWDHRDSQIRAAVTQGQKELTVPVLPYLPADIGPDSDHWLNKCVANYYGLNSITAQ